MIDRVVSVVWLCVGVGAAFMAASMEIIGPGGPESGLFPFIAAVTISLSALCLVCAKSEYLATPEWPNRQGLLRICGIVAGVALTAILLSSIGFAMAGFITMMVLLRLVEAASWRSAVTLSLSSVALTIVLFDKLLGMPLPKGPWGF